MLLSIALLVGMISLEAMPVIGYLQQVRGDADPVLNVGDIGALAAAGTLALLTGLVPVRLAVRRLEELEA